MLYVNIVNPKLTTVVISHINVRGKHRGRGYMGWAGGGLSASEEEGADIVLNKVTNPVMEIVENIVYARALCMALWIF